MILMPLRLGGEAWASLVPSEAEENPSAVLRVNGEGGIRTHVPNKREPLFESGTLNHSVTSPDFKYYLKTLANKQ